MTGFWWRIWPKTERKDRGPVYRVRSAESRNYGADIPGAAADSERIGRAAKAALTGGHIEAAG